MTPTAPFNRMSRPEWLAYAKHRGYRVGSAVMTNDHRIGLGLIVRVDSEKAEIEVETRVDRDRLGPLVGPQWRGVIARELCEARRTARRLRDLHSGAAR